LRQTNIDFEQFKRSLKHFRSDVEIAAHYELWPRMWLLNWRSLLAYLLILVMYLRRFVSRPRPSPAATTRPRVNAATAASWAVIVVFYAWRKTPRCITDAWCVQFYEWTKIYEAVTDCRVPEARHARSLN